MANACVDSEGPKGTDKAGLAKRHSFSVAEYMAKFEGINSRKFLIGYSNWRDLVPNMAECFKWEKNSNSSAHFQSRFSPHAYLLKSHNKVF